MELIYKWIAYALGRRICYWVMVRVLNKVVDNYSERELSEITLQDVMDFIGGTNEHVHSKH